MVRKNQLAAELAQAVQERDFYKGQVDNAGPWLGIAEDLHKRVAARLSAVDSNDLDAALAITISQTEDDLVRQGIEAKIAEMPTSELLGRYAILIGDESVNEPLRRVAELEHRKTVRKANLATIAYEAEISRKLDFRWIDADEIVTVGLHKPYYVDNGTPETAARIITMQRRNEKDAVFQVLSDTLGATGYWSNTPDSSLRRFSDHSIVQLGTVPGGVKDDFEPIVYQGSAIATRRIGDGNNVKVLDLDLGYVSDSTGGVLLGPKKPQQ